jgi:hypothetical protein
MEILMMNSHLPSNGKLRSKHLKLLKALKALDDLRLTGPLEVERYLLK